MTLHDPEMAQRNLERARKAAEALGTRHLTHPANKLGRLQTAQTITLPTWKQGKKLYRFESDRTEGYIWAESPQDARQQLVEAAKDCRDVIVEEVQP